MKEKVFKVWMFPEQLIVLKEWQKKYTKYYCNEKPYTITIIPGHSKKRRTR